MNRHGARAPRSEGAGAVGPGKGHPVKYLLAVLVLAIGVAAVVYGGADDSPGLQLLGVLLALGAVASGVRTARRRT